jgi:hypothetical protein
MCLVVPAITISADSNIVVPASAVTASSGKLYTVINRSTSYAVTIKLSATTGVTIPANTTKTVIYNGTDFQEAFTALNFLTLTGTPTVNAHAVNKGYVDGKFFINAGANTVTGNTTFTGTVTLPVATPTGNQATSYNYVNSNYLWKAAGESTQTMIPFLRLNYTPTNPADAVHKAYVDAFSITAALPLTATGNAGTGISMNVATATSSSLGVVKGGGNVLIAGDGTMSVSGIGAGTVTSVSGSVGSGFVVDTGVNPTTTPTVSVTISTGLTSLLKGSAGSLANASASDITSLIGGSTYYPFSSNPANYQNASGTVATAGTCTGNAATASAPSGGGSFITSSNIGSQSVATAGTCTGNAATASAPSGGGSFITDLNIGSQTVANANALGGVAASGYVLKTGSTMTGALNVQNSGSPSGYVSVDTVFNGSDYFPAILSVNTAASTYRPLVLAQLSTLNIYEVRLAIGTGGAVTIPNLAAGGTVTAGVGTGTLTILSDQNLKIADGFVEDGLSKIDALQPRYFYWKDEEGNANLEEGRQLGFYAQEVQAVSQEASPTGQGIYDRAIIAMLVKAVQELKTEVEALKGA